MKERKKAVNDIDAGLEIATNTVTFVTERFPFATKTSPAVANL